MRTKRVTIKLLRFMRAFALSAALLMLAAVLNFLVARAANAAEPISPGLIERLSHLDPNIRQEALKELKKLPFESRFEIAKLRDDPNIGPEIHSVAENLLLNMTTEYIYQKYSAKNPDSPFIKDFLGVELTPGVAIVGKVEPAKKAEYQKLSIDEEQTDDNDPNVSYYSIFVGVNGIQERDREEFIKTAIHKALQNPSGRVELDVARVKVESNCREGNKESSFEKSLFVSLPKKYFDLLPPKPPIKEASVTDPSCAAESLANTATAAAAKVAGKSLPTTQACATQPATMQTSVTAAQVKPAVKAENNRSPGFSPIIYEDSVDRSLAGTPAHSK